MNGTSRLYRSTSEAMLGGVAAGIGNYLKIDPVIVRIAFVLLTLITGGFFLLAYLAMWLLIPTAGSTASQPGEVVQENLNDLSSRVRSFTGMNTGGSSSGSPTGPTNGGNGGNGGNGTPNGTNMVSTQARAAHHAGIGPMILIGLGLFFLLGNVGFFHLLVWHAFWPILLIFLGFMLLSRRNR